MGDILDYKINTTWFYIPNSSGNISFPDFSAMRVWYIQYLHLSNEDQKKPSARLTSSSLVERSNWG